MSDETKRWMQIYDALDKAQGLRQPYVYLTLSEEEKRTLVELDYIVQDTPNGTKVSAEI